MLSTFVGAYDVVHCKDVSKSVPATADNYNKHMGGIDKSDPILLCLSRWKKIILVGKESNF